MNEACACSHANSWPALPHDRVPVTKVLAVHDRSCAQAAELRFRDAFGRFHHRPLSVYFTDQTESQEHESG